MTPKPRHLTDAVSDVARHGERQLAVRLDIEFVESADEHLVRAGRHPDAHLAAGFLERRILGFESADEG